MDENVSNAIANGLKQRGIDVTTTAEANLISASDKEQIAFALAQKRVIFTQDDDFLRLHQAGVAHYGIIYCRQRSRTISEIINSIALIWEWVESDDIQGRVEFI